MRACLRACVIIGWGGSLAYRKVLLKQGLDIVLTHAAEVLPQSHEFEYQIRGAVELDDDRDNKAGCLVGLFLDFDRNMPGSTHPNSPKIKIRAAGVPRESTDTHKTRCRRGVTGVYTSGGYLSRRLP